MRYPAANNTVGGGDGSNGVDGDLLMMMIVPTELTVNGYLAK